ncbi:MAG: hypothetical protein WA688_04760 [Thermoplasmata archaeon]
MTVHEKAPLTPVVSEEPPEQLELVIVAPSKTNDCNVVETEKPVPDTVTVAPIGPWPGVTVNSSVVTVKVSAMVRVLVAVFSPTTR